MAGEDLRILVGPIDTASFPSRLGRSLAQQGCRVWVLNTSPHQYHASQDRLGAARPVLSRAFRFTRWLGDKGTFGALCSAPLKQLLTFCVFLWSLVAIDAIVFVSGRSLLYGYFDLWVYQRLGKRVVRVFLGSDSRPKYLSGPRDAIVQASTEKAACRKLASAVHRQQKRITRMSRWSNVVIENPLCGHYQTKPFVNWFCIGFPHAPDFFRQHALKNRQLPGDHNPETLKVLHCPSNPHIKGTDRVDAMMQKLQDQGMPLEYVRITGMPHHVVLQHLQTCDFVIDELYSDTPMAGFASEAAAFGRAALIGGYGWQAIRDSVPSEFIAPNICITPEDFEELLPTFLRDKERCQEAGTQAKEFMNGCWNETAVASRFLRILNDDIPQEWLVNPQDIGYWQGLGATQEHRREVLQKFVHNEGLPALRVNPHSQFYASMSCWQSDGWPA